MFGAFRPSSILNGGLVWKSPYRLSATRKANLRHRLKRVDSVIAAVAESGVECRALSRALELPKESEMAAKGEYAAGRRPVAAELVEECKMGDGAECGWTDGG